MKVALYIAFQNKSSIDCCKEIIDLISENNQLIIDSKVKNDLDESKRDNFIFFDSNEQIDSDIDFVFAIGGDGTILRSITYVKDSNIPILGVNTGKLGFLTSIQKESISDAISNIKNKEYTIIERTILKVNHLGSSNNTFANYPYALNEITIQRKGHYFSFKYLM
jgi:NAD+ kinase